MGVVQTCGDQLLALINDILDFSKIEAGKLEFEELDFDLPSAVEEVADMLAMRAVEKGLEFTCYVSPDIPPRLRGDPGRLRQILINLANNAVKFTEAGEVAIRADLESRSEDAARIRFQVRDTGIGIPEERRDRLFRSFSQADASTTRKYGGTGLGLAISRRLAELMGGEIGVDSVEGEGTTFWFTVALRIQPRVSQDDAPRPEIRGRRVLVVDDNDTNRLIVRNYLKAWGADCAEASSAAEALDLLQKAHERGKPFEMALLDRLMPEVDGEDLGCQIKDSQDLHNTRLVMLTSALLSGDRERLAQIGFARCLTKPIRKSQLHDVLVDVLDETGGGGRRPMAPVASAELSGIALPSGLRILLAEDNIVNQRVALAVLKKKLGLRADAVANGREVLQALRQIDYDVVLMDCHMPEMDGYEATRCIRSGLPGIRNPGVAIVAMTANAMEGDREECLAAGMDDYVPKPVRPEALAEALARVCAPDRADRRPEPA